MSRGDLLLRWASCYQELRAARVQAAAERLCAPPVSMERDDPRMAPYLRAAKRLMRNLVRMGHLEELASDRFRTVPPTLVAQEGDRFLVTGARSEALREQLARTTGASVLPAAPQHEGPAVWQVVGNQDVVASAANAIGLTVTRDRGAELLASLPCLIDTLAGAPSEGIPDKTERWTPDAPIGRPRWRRTTADGHAPGLYRTVRKPHQWYLRPAEAAPTTRLNTPERRVAAAWLLLRDKVRLEYARDARVLSVPAIGFGLPLLVDRALILASGRLPEWRSRHWDYFDIDPERARHVARILGARIEVST
jgi:hypothetical protein